MGLLGQKEGEREKRIRSKRLTENLLVLALKTILFQ